MKKKKDPTPGPRIQEMSLSDVAEMNVKAIETGDPSVLLETLRRSIEPPPPYDAPAKYVIDLPVKKQGDVVTIGAVHLRWIYDGEGSEVTIETPQGHQYVVSIVRLAAIMAAVQAAMFSGPGPRPALGVARPYP